MDERPNLTPIEGGKAKRRVSREGDDGGARRPTKIARAELCEIVARVMLGGQSVFANAFPHKFLVLQPNPSALILLEEDATGVVRVVPRRHIANAVVGYLVAEGRPEFFATYKTALEIVDFWAALASPLGDADIVMIRWRGEPGRCWQRLPWTRAEGATPAWDSVTKRMTNAEAVCDYIGSVLVAESDTHQYCWITGRGHDGKGAVNRFLSAAIGPSYRSKHPPKGQDKFWTYGLIGARLVVLPDCDNSEFVRSGFFKALTGGDPVDVEAKGQMSGTVRLNCKFLIFSNETPAVGTSEADQRRIIYSEFKAPGEYEHDFEARLWAEGGGFLAKCIAGYLSRYPNHGPIRCDREAIEDIAQAVEDEFESAFETNFMLAAVPPRGGNTAYSEHALRAFAVRSTLMQVSLTKMFPNNEAARRRFMSWLRRRHGVAFARLTVRCPRGDYRDRFYLGLMSKGPVEQSEAIYGAILE